MSLDEPRSLLERYGRDHQPIGALRSLGGFGGLSGSRLWRFTSTAGERLMREWPDSGQGRERVETIHEWLGAVHDLAFVPQPIPALDGRTVQELQGRCWELVPWLPGAAETTHPPRVERVRAAFVALSAFHDRLARDEPPAPSPGLRLRCVELERLAAVGFDAIEDELRGAIGDPLRDSAWEWLILARATTPALLRNVDAARRIVAPLQPCLRDARPEHFLFEGDRVTGLVDFGAMDVETVAADLARLLGEWLPIPGSEALRAAAIQSYTEVRPLSQAQLDQAAAFEAIADALIGERWVRWRFRERRRFESPSACADGMERGLRRLKSLSARLV